MSEIVIHLDEIPEYRPFPLSRICLIAILYLILQAGDFYFYITEPSYPVGDFSSRFWLLANGILGIQSALLFVVYQWAKSLRAPIQLTCTIFLFIIFGVVWTGFGWACIYYIKHSSNTDEIFQNYLWFKLSIQSFAYGITYLLFISNQQ